MLVKFTGATNGYISVNPENVLYVNTYGNDGATIQVSNGDELVVRESVDEVTDKLNAAYTVTEEVETVTTETTVKSSS